MMQRWRSCGPQPTTFNVSHIQVGDTEIHPVSVVRNIGARLDETVSMRSHVKKMKTRLAVSLLF